MTVPNSTGIVYELPGNIFTDCANLQQITGCFREQTVKYKLTSKGFINSKITNAAYAFYENALSFTKEGGIPYGLFYMEQDTTNTCVGWNHADATRLNVDENFWNYRSR